MRKRTILATVCLVVAVVPRPAPAMSDIDALYCAQVYAQAAEEFAAGADAETTLAGLEAGTRALPLMQRDNDLLNDDPQRHARASAEAERRLAALPAAPAAAHGAALRSAYEQCLTLDDLNPGSASARVRLTGNRRFCRDLMTRAGKVSPKLSAKFSSEERATLDELLRIAQALSQPLPGRPLTPAEDQEANQLAAQRRYTLDAAMAGWSGQQDPMVKELGKCHEDYAQGLLGGPNVLAPATASAASTASSPAEQIAAAPTVDLGAVFHMREVAPEGNYEGIWRRRGHSNLYDGVWVHVPSGRLQQDVLEVRGVEQGELRIDRRGAGGSYRARVRADGTLAPGRASWNGSPAYHWSALPAQPARGADLGAAVHMREVGPGGSFEGIWRRRGRSNVYDALWVHLASGEVVGEVLAVVGVQQGRLVLRRQAGRGLYPVPLRADGERLAHAADLQWTLLPAQAVSVSLPR